MRILAIRGSNLASLAGEFAIDFEAEPLASSGIFAITGPTGAGKSTLLDAVCLALFAKIPRLNAAPDRSQVGGEGDDTLSAKDARSILRHGTGEGYAEVDFRMPGGATYRARWSVRRARGQAEGRLQNNEHTFERLDTAVRMGGKRGETKEAIINVIGLSAEQFTRAVLLAQGDFEAFIRADANERAVLLERLTGSEIYTRLGQNAYAKASSLKEELNAIRAKIEAQDGLDDEARTEAEAALAAAGKAHDEAQAQVTALRAEEQRQQRAAELAGEIERADKARTDALETREAAQERREALDRDKAAVTLAPLLSVRLSAEKALSSTKERLADARKAHEKARDEARTRAGEAETAEAALREREAQAQALAPAIASARTLDQQLAHALADLEAAGQDAAGKDRVAAEAGRAAEKAEGAFREAGERRQAAQDWCEANAPLRALAERESEIADMLASHATTLARHGEYSSRRAGLEEAERSALARHGEASAAVETAQQTHQARKDALALALVEAPQGGALEQLSQRLGAIGRAEAQAMQAAQARRECARGEKALGEARERMAAFNGEATTLDETIREDEASLPGLEARLANANGVLARALAASDQAAQAMRAALVEGEPCPVCGATAHALTALDALLGENLEQSRSEVDGLAAERDRVRTRHQVSLARRDSLVAQIAKAESDQTDMAAQQENLIADRETRHEALLGAVRALGLDAGADVGDAIAPLLAEARAAADARQQAALAAQNAAEATRRAEEQARTAHEAAREALDKAAESLRHHAQALKEADGEIVRLAQSTDEQAKALDRALSPMMDWRTLPDAASWLREAAGQWRRNDAGLRQASEALPALDLERQTCASTRVAAAEAARLAREAVGTAETLAAARRESRAGLLGGESVQAVEERLAAALAEARAAQDTVRTAREKAGEALASAAATLAGTEAAKVQAGTDLEAARTGLARRLASSGIAEADVVRVADAGQAVLDAEAEALAALDTAVREAEAVLAKCREDLARHRGEQEGARPPPPKHLPRPWPPHPICWTRPRKLATPPG